jgi:cytochrome c oxidase subunit 1
LGGVMYIVVVVGSVLFGKPRDAESIRLYPAVGPGGGAAAAHYGSEGTLKLPGTVTLVVIFFLSFALYYFVNWKYLSEIWPLH